MRYLVLAAMLLGCGDEGATGPSFDPPELRPEPATDWNRDILVTELEIDVSTRRGRARIEVASSESRALSLEVGDLEIDSVSDDFGALEYAHDLRRLDIGLPMTGESHEVVIEYGYFEHDRFEGASSKGWTLTWPYHCGNLFPCKSDPAEGSRFTVELSGVADDEIAIYPQSIDADSPSYMLAWAVGKYSYESLGSTPGGVEVGFYYQEGGAESARLGTENLPAILEWLETTLGPYPFGNRVAAVATEWGFGQFGGMEHHPFWHVATNAMSSHQTQAHEAAHGWFGNGVRLACWEDLVLSEGPTTYLAARATEVAVGASDGEEIWNRYREELPATEGLPAWPEGCGQIDVIEDQLFTRAPYIRGAFFLRSVANVVGADTLDSALGSFVRNRIGSATTFQDLLDHLKATTGFDPQACAVAWLRSDSLPDSESCD